MLAVKQLSRKNLPLRESFFPGTTIAKHSLNQVLLSSEFLHDMLLEMNMKKVLVLLLVLTGCASSPKPMPETGYQQLPLMLVAAQRCAQQGMLSPSLAAFGNTYLRQQAGIWEVDMDRWNERINHLQSSPAPNQANCNGLAIALEGFKQQAKQQQADDQYQREEVQRLADKMAAPAGRTFCNNIGGYVLCNSY